MPRCRASKITGASFIKFGRAPTTLQISLYVCFQMLHKTRGYFRAIKMFPAPRRPFSPRVRRSDGCVCNVRNALTQPGMSRLDEYLPNLHAQYQPLHLQRSTRRAGRSPSPHTASMEQLPVYTFSMGQHDIGNRYQGGNFLRRPRVEKEKIFRPSRPARSIRALFSGPSPITQLEPLSCRSAAAASST